MIANDAIVVVRNDGDETDTMSYRTFTEHFEPFGWFVVSTVRAMNYHGANYTCGGVTGHAQDCDRVTCETIIHQGCNVQSVHYTDAGNAMVFYPQYA